MAFQAVTNHDNAGNLADVSPQPYTPGLQYPEVRFNAGGGADRHGLAYFEWHYGFMTRAQFAAMQTQLGLSESTKSANVTVRTLINSDFQTFANYNAKAINPEADQGYKFEGGMYQDVVWRFNVVEAL
jgi:hypothetical protein